jgi:WD40 repeat protein
VPTLRLLETKPTSGGHRGEMLCCAYTPDSAFVLSGGWDGHLRLWDVSCGAPLRAFPVNDKPISACAVSPDGGQWVSGGLDGLLAFWDPVSQQRRTMFLAHPRPISAIAFSPDGRTMATASWDCTVTLWNTGRERDGRTLNGHKDIVAGCQFALAGRALLSWSYDGTLRTWDLLRNQLASTLTGHADRVTAGALSPDGRWAASGAVDGTLKLWDLQADLEAGSLMLGAAIPSCLFLLDAESLVAVTKDGRVTVHALRGLEVRSELATGLTVQCADLAPSSAQLVLGTDTGGMRLVAVDGLEDAALVVNLTQESRLTQSTLQRLIGKSSLTSVYRGACPVCRQGFVLSRAAPGLITACPHCRQRLRVNEVSQK